VGSEGSRRQNAGLTNRKRIRRIRGVRRPISLKPGTDTEHVDVNATVISVKGVRITRGDLADCQELGESRDFPMIRQKSAEGIRGSVRRTKGPNG
jgi:hypothetical protein